MIIRTDECQPAVYPSPLEENVRRLEDVCLYDTSEQISSYTCYTRAASP